jgi:predicted Fe-Mo cluster-binding NifX family protein
MKIAVASDDQKSVCGHVGRCQGFLVYVVKDKTIERKEYRVNDFTNHAKGEDHDHHAAAGISHPWLQQALKDCQAIISLGMGRRLWDDMAALKMEPIITDVEDADKAVALYLEGNLPKYDSSKACVH